MKQSHSIPLGTELLSHSVSLCISQNFTGKFIYLGLELLFVTRDAVGMSECETLLSVPLPTGLLMLSSTGLG